LNFADLNSHITGSTRGKLNKGRLNKIKIPIPPLKTQQRIAGILDDAAALRDKTAQLLIEYDLLAQSVFLKMFGNPVINEKEWDKEPLIKLGKTTTGNTPSRAVSEYYGDYIEWIKTDNINTPNMLLTKADEYLSKLGLTKARKVAKGAILVTCIAGSRRVIGNVSITDRLVSFNQQINAFEAFNGCSLFWYYQFILAKPYVQNNSTNGMKGIITKGKFEKMMFINPPIELQNEFAEKIALIEQQKAVAKQELQESEDLFNCLLQQAFKGELV
jgi:type I restriction enzyme S subunit